MLVSSEWAGNAKEVSSFPGGRKPPEAQARQRTELPSAFKFGPLASDPAQFRLTAAVPDVRVSGSSFTHPASESV